MTKSTRLLAVLCLCCATFFVATSVAAIAQQQVNQPTKKPAQKVAPVKQKSAVVPGRQIGGVQQPIRRGPQPTNPSGIQQTNRVGQPRNTTSFQNTNHNGSKNVSAGRHTVVAGAKGYRFGTRGVRRDVRTFNQRERLAWQRGRWRHERHFGRDGWWWEVNGAWYWYEAPLEGPPDYVSDVELVDDVVDVPPAGAVEYPEPPPAPPPSAVFGGAVGGAIVGGILGGALTGRSGGAAAGALIGGVTGAAIGAEAERRNGYYWWQGNCYYRYPSGEYAPVAPGHCD